MIVLLTYITAMHVKKNIERNNGPCRFTKYPWNPCCFCKQVVGSNNLQQILKQKEIPCVQNVRYSHRYLDSILWIWSTINQTNDFEILDN